MTSRVPQTALRFAAAASQQPDTARALDEVSTQVAEALAGPADLLAVFASPHHADEAHRLGAELNRRLAPAHLVGATGESIIAGPREFEAQPALAVWGARLGAARLHSLHLDLLQTPEGPLITGWPEALARTWQEEATLLVLGEPFSFPAELLLERLNDERPGVQVVGGMASGGWQPGQNRLWLGDRQFTSGAVAVLIEGPPAVESIVSQGCRPIGRHFVITKAQQNVIFELSGRPALAQLGDVLEELPPHERQLARGGLFLGRVTNEYQDRFGRGDFLVRNVIGVDRVGGAISVGDYVRPGQTVQFHLRDAHSADEDLRELLAAAAPPAAEAARGALVFSCNGRGTRFFDQPDHDAAAIRDCWGEIPLAGFFAQGEFGPVGGRNYIHGYTASVALFRGGAAEIS